MYQAALCGQCGAPIRVAGAQACGSCGSLVSSAYVGPAVAPPPTPHAPTPHAPTTSAATTSAATAHAPTHAAAAPADNSPAGADPDVVALIQAGNKIGAIKIYRERHNTGLREAKDFVDALALQLR